MTPLPLYGEAGQDKNALKHQMNMAYLSHINRYAFDKGLIDEETFYKMEEKIIIIAYQAEDKAG